MKKEEFITSRGERTSYGIYFFGQLLMFGLVTSFLQLYLTNMGISAIAVGTIFLFAKIWDSVNDPIFGVIVDKMKFKKGKYTPWIKLSTILIPVTTLLMFAIPSGVSVEVKTIWAAVAYLLWDLAYTMCDVPIFAVATSMTSKVFERDKLYALNRFFCFLGVFAVAFVVPIMYPMLGWTFTTAVLCVASLATMLPIGFLAKERIHVKEEKSPSVKELFKYLIHNKYLLLFNGVIILNSLTNTASAVSNYFAINNLGGPQWISILTLISFGPMMIIALIVPKVIKHVDKMKVYRVGLAGSILCSVLMFFIGYTNMTAFLLMTMLRSLSGGFCGMTMVMIIADCAEYGHFHTGERAQGIAFSIQTFTSKLSTALSSTICMFVLGIVGFQSSEGVVQTAGTLNAMWFLYSAFPAVAGIISLFLLSFLYKLNDKDVQIMSLHNYGELSREDAELQLSRKY